MRVLLLDLDSTRPDHLGCYGYHRDTSPNIDRICKDGVRFTNYYTSDAPCAPSRSALMSGQLGIHNGLVGHGGTAGDVRHDGPKRDFSDRLALESLPSFVDQAGLKPVLISPFAQRHGTWNFYAGFREMHNTGKAGIESAEEVTPEVLKWLEHNAEEDNWFLYVNYWDPHTPYRAPEEFGNPFENDPLPVWITEEVLEEHKKKVGPHSASEINMYDNKQNPDFPRSPGEIKDMAGLRQMIDGYDCGVRWMDDNLGKVFKSLEDLGIMEETIIIITGDHGENMGELGIYGEHGTADHATCNIPMIIRWPGVTKPGHVDDELHYHLDLNPTLADILNRQPASGWDGQSYAPALKGETGSGRDYLVVSQCAHVCQRSVRFDDWLYIRTYHDGYHLFDKEMLFNIKNDPHEVQNVAKEYPQICKEAVYRLNEWHEEMMHTSSSDVDPLWTVMREGGPFHAKGSLPKYIQHLEKTGREYAVEELKRRHPNEFK
ncbi:sulfatase family protein [Rossellomorea arthrocnemi]|uniref:sulfatase family protein n=1 Tax=Rossellomorea arthrocnemi TaxID=2769542 RepID=UPI0019194D2D|nr:sulfatase [Rossellomorea arthrocnemi]